MLNISEQFCLAVDEIVSKRLEGINYDTTITGTIIDNSNANNYQYTCSNGSAQFIAYSKETNYKVGDSVQITIPNNDYNQQKIIIGKYVAKENDKPYIFNQPFDTIIDITTNLIDDNKEPIKASLLANEDYDDTSTEDFFNYEILLYSKMYDEPLVGYDRLGLRGEFRSWLNSLKPKSGNYGYRLEIYSEIPNNEESYIKNWIKLYNDMISGNNYDDYWTAMMYETPDSWFEDIGYQKIIFMAIINADQNSIELKQQLVRTMIYAHCQIVNLYLDAEDMYGNPYNYQGYFQQEKVFDIKEIESILGFSLTFYETSRSFFDELDNDLPYRDKFNNKLSSNLFTQEPYICLGYSLENFDKEQAILYSVNSLAYGYEDDPQSEENIKKNIKVIRLRWLHKFDNGEIKVVNEETALDYQIRWYRFKMGAPSADQYSGVYWERQDEDSFNFTFVPKHNLSSEQIKCIVLYEDKIIRSNILTFENEKQVVNEATVELLTGLSVWCKDNSYGNYYLYGQNNDLINTAKANEVLTLEARFATSEILEEEEDVDEESSLLVEAKEITWEFPLKNTMLVVNGFNQDYLSEIKNYIEDNKEKDAKYENLLDIYENIQYNIIEELDPDKNDTFLNSIRNGSIFKDNAGYFNEEGTTLEVDQKLNVIRIIRKGNENRINPYQDYRIKKTYSASSIYNVVRCSVIKNGYIYSATKNFDFGVMGLNGTDATVVIDFANNKVALTANEMNETLKVVARLYDSNHQEVDFNNLDLDLKCKWSWAYYMVNADQSIDLTSRLILDENREIISENTEVKEMNICYLTHKTKLSIEKKNFFLVLRAEIIGYGDYTLTAYKAIPIRANRQYRSMIGPDTIIYNSSGYADYYKEPFQLMWCANSQNVNEYDMVIDQTTITQSATNWTLYNPYGESPGLIGWITDIQDRKPNILQPASVYIKNASPYGAICYSNTDTSHSNPVWIQPFVIMQNQYPSATLNRWDGKTLELNDKEGYILSTAIAAGKKESNNTFTGVMIGDWSLNGKGDTSEDIGGLTGVYGFHKGAVSFAFKEDGTAFIGKSGRGRINFDGDTGIITSSSWTDTSEKGMFLDLDDGILKLQIEPGYNKIELTSETYVAGQYSIYETEYLQVRVGAEYDSNLTYYKRQHLVVSRIDEEIFNYKKKKNLLYTKTAEGSYVLVPSDATFNATTMYYEYTYVAQNLGQNAPSDWGTVGLYYTGTETFKISDDEYDPTQTYYIQSDNTNRYITLSADERTYPLAIGSNKNVSERKFRVMWDGTCYITDGFFEGVVQADELYSNYGRIGGWEIADCVLTGASGRIRLNSCQGYLAGNELMFHAVNGIFGGKDFALDAKTGALSNCTVNQNGQIVANTGKGNLEDFTNDGFYLNKEGFLVGNKKTYIRIISDGISFMGESNGLYTGVFISGEGILVDPFTSLGANNTTPNSSKLQIGYSSTSNNALPFIRLGAGSYSLNDAGCLKKFEGGLWLGNYTSGASPSGGGIYVALDGGGGTDEATGESLTAGQTYHYENGKYRNIKYAVFA